MTSFSKCSRTLCTLRLLKRTPSSNLHSALAVFVLAYLLSFHGMKVSVDGNFGCTHCLLKINKSVQFALISGCFCVGLLTFTPWDESKCRWKFWVHALFIEDKYNLSICTQLWLFLCWLTYFYSMG